MRSNHQVPCSRLQVHFIPFGADNPYQSLLAAGIEYQAVSVALGSTIGSLFKTACNEDLLHLHWLPTLQPGPRGAVRILRYLHNLRRLRRKGVPIVWTAHNLIPHESKLRFADLWVSQSVAGLADRIICHSQSARAELISRLQIRDATKIRVIPHGHYIDSYPNLLTASECRSRLSLSAEAVVFLSLGIIRPYKGVMELIDAFGRFPEPKARLLIAGKPYDQATDARVKARISADPRIRYFPGYVADADLQLYLNAADAVVFPYQKSLTSGALILAMSFGRACIAPRLPGMVDCLSEDGGIFYQPNDPAGLREALAAAVSRRGELAAMAEKNLHRAQAWDWTGIAKATVDCYREAVAVAKGAAP